jgi:hypothetical protein
MSADDLVLSREYHVRHFDRRVEDWIVAGAGRSRTFRKLLERIAPTDVVVYVEVVPRLSHGARARLLFVGAAERVRYLRIQVVLQSSSDEMVALLAHEFQHVVEVAGAPRVRDSATLARLYRGIGQEWHTNAFDSLAARETGQMVERELAVRSAARVGRK